MMLISAFVLLSAVLQEYAVHGGVWSERLCELADKECPGNNLGDKQYVPIANGCVAYCRRDDECEGAFVDKDNYCQLKTYISPCGEDDLVDRPGGIDYRRLKEDENPNCLNYNGRFLHEAPPNIYDEKNEYCKIAGKRCTGASFYPKPWMFYANVDMCENKCNNIITCGWYIYDELTNFCDVIKEDCTEDLLVDDLSVDTYRKTLIGETCPSAPSSTPCNPPCSSDDLCVTNSDGDYYCDCSKIPQVDDGSYKVMMSGNSCEIAFCVFTDFYCELGAGNYPMETIFSTDPYVCTIKCNGDCALVRDNPFLGFCELFVARKCSEPPLTGFTTYHVKGDSSTCEDVKNILESDLA